MCDIKIFSEKCTLWLSPKICLRRTENLESIRPLCKDQLLHFFSFVSMNRELSIVVQLNMSAGRDRTYVNHNNTKSSLKLFLYIFKVQ